MEVRVTSIEEQSTLIYTVILHVIFLKLCCELDRVKTVSIMFFVVTILLYYGFMSLMSTATLSMAIDERFLDLAKHTYINFIPSAIIYLGSVAVVSIDYTLKNMVKMK